MSVLSVHIPHVEGSASEQSPPEVPDRAQSANELPGRRSSMIREDAVRTWTLPISDNFTSRVWVSQDLSVYYNSEYVYAISPIAVDFSPGSVGS